MRRNQLLFSFVVAVVIGAFSGAACQCGGNPPTGDSDGGEAGDGGTGGSGEDGGTGGSGDAGNNPFLQDAGVVVLPDGGTCVQISCQGHLYACADCQDNDQDGKLDAYDPDCLGPCQNNESGFAGEIPGQNNAPCKQDCYFDQDTGSGNDKCEWDHRCDQKEPEQGCGYQSSLVGSSQCPVPQPQACITGLCGYLTPNGCDCFGCCELPAGSGKYVWVGSFDETGYTCSLQAMNDPAKCKPCTPVPSCLNGCGLCEICIGKPAPHPSCNNPDGGVPVDDAGVPIDGGTQCAPGVQPCGLAGQAPCDAGYYCVTGCCQPTVIN